MTRLDLVLCLRTEGMARVVPYTATYLGRIRKNMYMYLYVRIFSVTYGPWLKVRTYAPNPDFAILRRLERRCERATSLYKLVLTYSVLAPAICWLQTVARALQSRWHLIIT
jgi:hypothetical protein